MQLLGLIINKTRVLANKLFLMPAYNEASSSSEPCPTPSSGEAPSSQIATPAERETPASTSNGSSETDCARPGELDPDGPRHDNDHADIARIAILPTFEEIMSDRGEYLPTTDPSQWHHTGLRGRLDREFRLLREDSVGQLRCAIRTALNRLKYSTAAGGKENATYPPPPRDRNSFTYHRAEIVNVSFTVWAGLELTVGFRQPARGFDDEKKDPEQDPGQDPDQDPDQDSDQDTDTTHSVSRRNRREWWQGPARRQLQPGNVVGVVDARGSVMFFVVADSTLRSGADADIEKLPRWVARKKERRRYNLADNPYTAYVTLNLAVPENDQQVHAALDWLLQCARDHDGVTRSLARRRRHRRVLVEVPTVLLPSFQHTLEALQDTSRNLDARSNNAASTFPDLLAPPLIESSDDDQKEGEATKDSMSDARDDNGDNLNKDPPQDGTLLVVPHPLYAQQPGFAFDLSCLANDDSKLHHSMSRPLDPSVLSQSSRLDETQAIALIDMLSRALALVQGPPGTGKTFEGRALITVLLAIQKQAKLGPIICVSFTNQALDQILEHLHDEDNSRKIIRIGSRSKSEKLQDMTMRVVSAKARKARTRAEKKALKKHATRVRNLTKLIKSLVDRLYAAVSPETMVQFLQKHHQRAFEQLFGTEFNVEGAEGSALDDGWKAVNQDRPAQVIRRWLRGGNVLGTTSAETGETHVTRRPEELNNCDVFTLTRHERLSVYQWWQYKSFSHIQRVIVAQYAAYVEAKKEWDQQKESLDLALLGQADIIGMTTSGLARRFQMLKRLPSKAILAEEAGEVFESHMLTALLLPSVQHAVLIGDHQQLRPQVTNHNLSSESRDGAQYALDVSLFERLACPQHASHPRLPFSQLETQRRMHPLISTLIAKTLYPALKDGDNVRDYPEVPGFRRRLFWLDHQEPEREGRLATQAGEANTSCANVFEATMVTELVSHLVKQGTFASGDIAVITPYRGQMHLIRDMLSARFAVCLNDRDADERSLAKSDSLDGQIVRQPAAAETDLLQSVRLATVDNFQGEEARVVIISLVRSNARQQCGFLKSTNRINVLLSRAKEGTYIIGNSRCYARVPMWQQVIGLLEKGNNMGPELPLQCPRHSDWTFGVSQPEHFEELAPNGGCQRVCGKLLSCGAHLCEDKCHSGLLHQAVQCSRACARTLPGCGHKCSRLCKEPCARDCHVEIDSGPLLLPCGHHFETPRCWMVQKPDQVKCPEQVEKIVPGCGHTVSVPCRIDPTSNAFRCFAQCSALLGCGHKCKNKCHQCNPREDDDNRSSGSESLKDKHGACQETCGRLHDACQHTCTAPCHGDGPCPPCLCSLEKDSESSQADAGGQTPAEEPGDSIALFSL